MPLLGDEPLRFATDEDLLRLEPNLDDGKGNGIWPRVTAQGKRLRTYEPHHQEAMNELARRLRSRKGTAEPFELGRLDPRSQGRLRPAAANLALHFLLMAASNGNVDIERKAFHYWDRGGSLLDAEITMLDYDLDRSGTVSDDEKNQPFPARVIRG